MSTERSELLRCRLPCDALAPQLARRALNPLAELEPVREDALLIASELVTNAVLHSGCGPADEVEMVAELFPGGLVIAVTDVGRSDRTPEPRAQTESGGFGLRIVDAVATRWGADRTAGLRVWAELAIDV